MIARRELPEQFVAWNRKWRAPRGRTWTYPWRYRNSMVADWYKGPFGHQGNSETRTYEYPWAYHEVKKIGHGLQIVEIGGGLSGLQFVLAREGHSVTNIDPGAEGLGEWGFTHEAHQRLCRVFRSHVNLISRPLEDAGLPAHSADIVLCVSVLEHLEADALQRTAIAIQRILKPTGRMILTVDLFLDLFPFSSTPSGRWGRNVDVRELLDSAGLELAQGRREELFGYPEFSPQAIYDRRSELFVGKSMATAQCVVARPRNGA